MIEAIEYATAGQLAERKSHREILQRIAARAVVDHGIDLRRRFKVVEPESLAEPVAEPVQHFPPPLPVPLVKPPPREVRMSVPSRPVESPSNFVRHIQRMVAHEFDIEVDDLASSSRKGNVVFPRHIAMYLCRTMTSRSWGELSKFFGGRDHTTILYAVRKIDAWKLTDSYVCQVIVDLGDKLEKYLQKWRVAAKA